MPETVDPLSARLQLNATREAAIAEIMQLWKKMGEPGFNVFAPALGVTERTLHRWVRKYDGLRLILQTHGRDPEL